MLKASTQAGARYKTDFCPVPDRQGFLLLAKSTTMSEITTSYSSESVCKNAQQCLHQRAHNFFSKLMLIKAPKVNNFGQFLARRRRKFSITGIHT